MRQTCYHCAHWRISEKRKDGKSYLLDMAAFDFGRCAKLEIWEYLGKSWSCGDFKAAETAVIEIRKRNLECK